MGAIRAAGAGEPHRQHHEALRTSLVVRACSGPARDARERG